MIDDLAKTHPKGRAFSWARNQVVVAETLQSGPAAADCTDTGWQMETHGLSVKLFEKGNQTDTDMDTCMVWNMMEPLLEWTTINW